jgi:hypothetical protein
MLKRKLERQQKVLLSLREEPLLGSLDTSVPRIYIIANWVM